MSEGQRGSDHGGQQGGDQGEQRRGTLSVVPTPIGNPRDITLRALDVLRTAGLVAAEDTRRARRLLDAHDIDVRVVSCYDHNEQARTKELVAALNAGTDVALISDAGTPLVNDPGYLVVGAALADGLRVDPLPGASAAVSALVGSGLPANRFLYVGFLPRKSAARRTALTEVAPVAATLIFFEAPHRVVEMLADVREVLGDRSVALVRNLTKSYEEWLRGPLSQVYADLAARDEVRGEVTVVVEGARRRESATGGGAGALDPDRVIELLLGAGLDTRTVRSLAGELTGLHRNEVYDRVSALRPR
ncbi:MULTISPECIES: 16S rRNA (cytidine(1402)-2'-O)-methyltransferase [unclassified Solwaraspora]|uniref:16S rRNA (cytidine(1402)-2'-O)-methyltransferase n=1 Tax=unclassified Solwaraspora TaxID=2627926 RepID=UPI00259B3762|nr:16S rRNA (cytidine(1402)-2'-O)-methyltransferase [Solwaraspora sp. WMMA2056]WJK42180.1 16S rRNA (cytidine(1402)-2'-O)-methyltransferase [Solwaraspora sp. WMMA2056]